MKTRRSFLRVRKIIAAVALVSAVTASFAARPFGEASSVSAQETEKTQAGDAKRGAAAPKQLKIDLGKAVRVSLPKTLGALRPANFKTSDGKTGWVVRVPGSRPLATPAYADGMLFVGGGYGSHEFYAFNAKTGRLVWKTNTGDDGPTAAVVANGYVAFNTESCTLVVVGEKTGKVIWQEWLGDPLMSQPAISKGRLFMAYPAGQQGQVNQTIAPHSQHIAAAPNSGALPPNSQQEKPAPTNEQGSHRLLCADLKTGRHIWEQVISSDVISAPVVSEDKVYFTTFDGTSYCLDSADGRIIWKKENAGTSAPVVAGGQVLMTQKEARSGKSYEGMKRVDVRRGSDKDARLLASDEAAYLDRNKGGGVALKQAEQGTLDSSVGFGNAPASAGLGKANENVGVNTVVGGWAYQGSRAAYSKGQMLNAQGRYLNSVNATSGDATWRAEVRGEGLDGDAQVFSPPALGEQFMYLSSSLGHILSVNQKDGEVGFAYQFAEPMVFQPALAEGGIYVGTSNGLLICLKTGSADADGWYAWGGNAEHNKNR